MCGYRRRRGSIVLKLNRREAWLARARHVHLPAGNSAEVDGP
jgi:hypothetical protein